MSGRSCFPVGSLHNVALYYIKKHVHLLRLKSPLPHVPARTSTATQGQTAAAAEMLTGGLEGWAFILLQKDGEFGGETWMCLAQITG